MEAREKYIVTGLAGFIWSSGVRMSVLHGCFVAAYDKLTYAVSRMSHESIPDECMDFVRGDVCETEPVNDTFVNYDADAVFHITAMSHGDRSIYALAKFIRTNINETFLLLTESLRYNDALSGEKKSSFRFLNVSTDEVYSLLYSATKAANHIVSATHLTYSQSFCQT